MATNYKGTDLRIEIAAVGDAFDPATATFHPLVVRSADMNVEGETFSFDPETGDTDSYWSGGDETISRSWNISFDGYFHPEDPAYLIVENAAWKEDIADESAVSEKVYVRYYPTGKIDGRRVYEGYANPGSIGIPSERGGAIDSSYDLNGNGKLTRSSYTTPTP